MLFKTTFTVRYVGLFGLLPRTTMFNGISGQGEIIFCINTHETISRVFYTQYTNLLCLLAIIINKT